LLERTDVGDQRLDLGSGHLLAVRRHLSLAAGDDLGQFDVGLFLHLGRAEVPDLHRLAGGRVSGAVGAMTDSTRFVDRGGVCGCQTAVGKNLKVKALGSPEVQKMTDAEMMKVLTEGKGKMPAAKLPADDMKAVIGFVRALKK